MTWKPANPQAALRLAAVIVLLIGLAGAGIVYLTADEVPEDPWTQQIQNSKLYRRDLEIYGGKLNVIGADLAHGFARLWHGRTLALTIAVLAAFMSLVLVIIASHIQPAPDATHGAGKQPPGPDG